MKHSDRDESRPFSVIVKVAAGAALGLCAVSAGAQTTPPPPPVGDSGGLIANPQQGATPRLVAPTSPSPSPAFRPQEPAIAPLALPTVSGPLIVPTRAIHGEVPPSTQTWEPTGGILRNAPPGGLPVPSSDPLDIDPATDPVLRLAQTEVAGAAFRAAIAAAVEHAPSLDEAIAQRAEATGARNEAAARSVPTVDLSLSSFTILSRAFSNDPDNILERSRPANRTDGSLHIQQPLFDFGAIRQRVAAGDERVQAAIAGVEDTGGQLALRAVAAWYSVYGYRALVRLAEAFAVNQRELHASIEDRVRQGVAAPGDVAQVDSAIAASDAQLADFRRSLANAEAQYVAIIGAPAPASLGRAPVPDLGGIAAPTIAGDAAKLPTVRAARALADAAARDVKALKADRLPQVSGAVDAGRYGVFENARDYDVRGTVSVSMRLGGGAAQRVEQANARLSGAEARARRTRAEAERDATIALSDVAALEQAQAALGADYLASRTSRDVLVARFQVSRGTLFDVLGAEGNYFGVAARYIQTVIELDTARYALLARTGRLLPMLGIGTGALDPRLPRRYRTQQGQP